MEIYIFDWMVNDLNLKRNDLIVFAIVFNYRRGEWFNIPHKIISQWAGVTPRAVSRIIQRLCQMGVIEYQVLCNDEVGSYAEFKIPEKIIKKYCK